MSDLVDPKKADVVYETDEQVRYEVETTRDADGEMIERQIRPVPALAAVPA